MSRPCPYYAEEHDYYGLPAPDEKRKWRVRQHSEEHAPSWDRNFAVQLTEKQARAIADIMNEGDS